MTNMGRNLGGQLPLAKPPSIFKPFILVKFSRPVFAFLYDIPKNGKTGTKGASIPKKRIILEWRYPFMKFLLALSFVLTASSLAFANSVISCEEDRLASDGAKIGIELNNVGNSKFDLNATTTTNVFGQANVTVENLTNLTCRLEVALSKDQTYIKLKNLFCSPKAYASNGKMKELAVLEDEQSGLYKISETIYTAIPNDYVAVQPHMDSQKLGSDSFKCSLKLPVQ